MVHLTPRAVADGDLVPLVPRIRQRFTMCTLSRDVGPPAATAETAGIGDAGHFGTAL
jgi:hypothetical protein